jgi:hypothetical protein
MTEAAVSPPYKQLSSNGWRRVCAERLETRLGWLKHELISVHGNLSALKDHEQVLWRWREKAVGELNRIGQMRDEQRKIRDYRKLWLELS